jgi:hypothetical protein
MLGMKSIRWTIKEKMMTEKRTSSLTALPYNLFFGNRLNYIDHSEPTNPMLNLEIGGIPYRFSLANVAPDARDQLAKVVHQQMLEIHNNAVARTRLNVQSQFRDLLGL